MPLKGHKPDCRCRSCPAYQLLPGYPSHKRGCSCTLCRACRREAQAKPVANRESPSVIRVVAPDALEVRGDYEQTARGRVAAWVAMRAQDPNLSTSEIARQIGLHPNTLNSILSKAVREGWLHFDDPLERLEYEIIPKTVDTLSEALNDGDRKVALETAKATVFRQYLDSKGIKDAAQTVLALKIETAPAETVKVLAGHVLGAPRVVQE